MIIGEVEDYIDYLMEQELKPELRRKMVYQVLDVDSNVLADIVCSLQPPMIRFYSRNISKLRDVDLKSRIKRIISHEIAHLFRANEHEAIVHQNLNIWQKQNLPPLQK